MKIPQINNLFRVFIIAMTVMMLSSCGFSFRGKINQDLSGVRINIDAQEKFHPLVLRLKRKLLALGAVISMVDSNLQMKQNATTKATSVLLRISNPIEKQKTLSVDDTGRPLEYELHIEVSVVVTNQSINPIDSAKLLPSLIFVRRVLVYDNNQLLAKSRERDEVRAEIYDVLIQQLIVRIRGAHAVNS